MGNVFKSVAKFLDNALSGGEVDVIVMDASAATADRSLSNQADTAVGVADAAVEADTAGAESVTGELVTGSEGEGAGDNAGTGEADAADEAVEGDTAGDAGDSAEGVAADAGDGANAAETQGMAAVQQMLGEGQVAINAAELESLRVDAAKWNDNKTELENLREWKANGSQANVMQGAADAADAVGSKPRKVSAQTQAAIDLQEKMEAQRKK
jgi:hypothetical protein